ncbi:DUF533 domain-containing protein [Thiohalocapsa sp. ML1]|jgi:uncharacterized membrane protein YebE (DUF533 family)|uniref:DUF533 domain-containing protein n=1 Tax=Thiohalocapsa sp. ML1 TaxID=1431688 RepID=UPI0007320BDE|nr:DUF533 domain-containing protein [Thiohalocapsa sp. ML1]
MNDFGSLVGAFMQSAMAPSAGNRIGSALEQLQRTGLGAMGGGGAPGMGGTPADMSGMLGGLLDIVKSGLGNAAQQPGQSGGLGAVLGSLMSGGGTGAAAQGGMLAVLAGVAMKALTSAGEAQAAGGQGGGLAELLGGLMPGGQSGQSGPWSGGNVPLGLRAPQNTAEQEALESTAQLVLKGMINAAKSDGQISPDEMQRIVGKLQEGGADSGMQQWVMQQMQTPLNVQAFAAEMPNQEVAAQVYAASLLAVEVDTDAERQYLAQFAQASGLHPLVVGQIQQTLGVTA